MKQRIVITRPAHQSDLLSQGIKKAGGEVCLFPTLGITSIELSKESTENLQNIKDYDILIFISPNAIQYGLDYIPEQILLKEDILLATIGQSSAETLHNKIGKYPDIVPEKNFNSEGLLATSTLQNVKNKRILIIRGNDGREHLKQVLQQRGAQTDYLDVYKRIKPTTDSTELEQDLQNNQIAAIVITSETSLKNLVELVPEKARYLLFQSTLLLINQRLINKAKELGFNKNFIIANEASDTSIIKALNDNHVL